MVEAELFKARDQHQGWLAQLPGFKGVGIGVSKQGETCLKIFTSKMPVPTAQAIAAKLLDVPYELEETGDVWAAGS